MTSSATTSSTESTVRPQSVDRAYLAAWVWATLTVVSALDLFLHRSYLRDALVEANDKADKDHKRNLAGSKLDQAVSSDLVWRLVVAAILAGIVVLLAVAMRRGKSWARWVLCVIGIVPVLGVGLLVQLVGGIMLDAPIDYKILLVLAGLACLATLVFTLMPSTHRWFTAIRPAGAAPGLLGGLFGRRPMRPIEDDEPRATTRTAGKRSSTRDEVVSAETVGATAGRGTPRSASDAAGSGPRGGKRKRPAAAGAVATAEPAPAAESDSVTADEQIDTTTADAVPADTAGGADTHTDTHTETVSTAPASAGGRKRAGAKPKRSTATGPGRSERR